MKANGAVTIPRVRDVRTAVRIYYTYNDMGTAEIKELFGCSTTKATELKKLAWEKMLEQGVQPRSRMGVCTDAAYEAWGLDIEALERRMKRAEKLGIYGGAQA